MKLIKKKVAMGLALISAGLLSGQAKPSPEAYPGADPEVLMSFEQKFLINSDEIFSSPELKQKALEVDSVLRIDTVKYVDIRGFASIDGPVAFNKSLAKERAKMMSDWLTKSTMVDPSIIRITSNGEDWDMFDSLVKLDTQVPMREEVLRIANTNQTILQKQYALKALGGGVVWNYLAKTVLPEMRVAKVTLGGYQFVVKLDKTEPVEEVVVEEVVEVVEPAPVLIEPEYWTRKLYVKTNAPAWLMLWINAAVEVDLAPHWSFNLPIYYSGFNYFKRNLKFRTFSVVPEFRWWPREDNMGFFLNGHLGMNLFNYAKGGDWRYQTWHGHSPALGGGIGLGYRWYFCRNHRWSMEAAIGAGVYHLDYSIFENKNDGLIVGRRIRTFFGIDQAALSFNYSFGVQNKEVKKGEEVTK